MKASVGLCKVFGIPLRLHFSWFIIFVLVTVSLVDYPLAGASLPPIEQRIVFGILASILFFASIVTHELAHCILALRNDVPVREITLFVFGGISHITKEATQPRAELSIAVVGPLTSVGLAGAFYGLHLLVARTPVALAASLLLWLALVNVALAGFNLIPAFPLDGGRVLRALVWRKTSDYRRATRIATRLGQALAYVFIVGGVALVFFARETWFGGLWIILVGWFILGAAKASSRQLLLRDALAGVTARQVTDYGCPSVSPDLDLGEVIERHVLPTGRDCLLVTRGRELEGMITLGQMKRIARTDWPRTPVRDIMIPADRMRAAFPDQDLIAVLQDMSGETADHIPVIEDGEALGVIHRDELARFIRTRTDSRLRSVTG